MKKITEIREIKFRTVHTFDSNGHRISSKETYTGFRTVHCIVGIKRFLHLIVDCLIILGLLYAFDLVFGLEMTENFFYSHVYFIRSFYFLVLFFSYYFLLEYLFQTTIGKILSNSVVIDLYGKKPRPKSLFVRSLVRLIPWDLYTFIYEDRGWHDKWSDTFVVSKTEWKTLNELLEKETKEETGNID